MDDYSPIDGAGRELAGWALRESNLRDELRHHGARHIRYAGDGMLEIVIDAREVVWQAPAPPVLGGPN